MAYLDDLSRTNPLVTTKVGGTTGEGRNIVQATISSNLTANKPVNFFDCDIHAREWITTSTCVWIIDQASPLQKLESRKCEISKSIKFLNFQMTSEL